MLFNSLTFVGFFAVVYGGYLLLRRRYIRQNYFLLAASYAFYGFWDWRFLGLLLGVTIVNFHAGRFISQADNPRTRNGWLAAALVVSFGTLGFFKYFNFFAESAAEVLRLAGLAADPVTLKIILPVGISFFTFQSLTYPLDLHRKRLQHAASFRDFALFTSFFPQIMAGPIERAANMLPQYAKPRVIDAARINAGLYLILWGYFKKVVVADNVAPIANRIFDNYQQFQGLDIAFGVLAFAVQLYSDFSGYSDIARGLAKMMGFNLMVNFKLPYLAVNPGDFWRRWHISLTSWFRDYLWWNLAKKIPVGGRGWNQVRWNGALVFVFLVSGLWHGAAWNYVLWGGFHGLLLVVYGLYERYRGERPVQVSFPRFRTFVAMTGTSMMVMTGWVLFRATSMDQIVGMLSRVGLSASDQTAAMAGELLFFVWPMILVELWQHFRRDLLIVLHWPQWVRTPLYAALLIAIFVYGVRTATEFLYFQF
ncbi:MAG: MBOAT family protein [candidate division Zixibacteria bacterium]|nr:MBOAT family protein [candidate division Zixibacteria bacterium]